MQEHLPLVREAIEQGLRELPPHLHAWAEAHLAALTPVVVHQDPDGQDPCTVIAVTGDTGVQDSGYFVVYDLDEEEFGLVAKMPSGVRWYMGVYGTFAEAVMNM